MCAIMGCKSTKPDSDLISNGGVCEEHTKGTRRKSKVHPNQPNGVIATESPNTEQYRKSMRGDLALYKEAKLIREKTMQERLRKRERLAGEISEKAMEEKEWLSLTSMRSRATSRIGSPKYGRGCTSVITTSELPLSLSPNDENSREANPAKKLKKDSRGRITSSRNRANAHSTPKPNTDSQSVSEDTSVEEDAASAETNNNASSSSETGTHGADKENQNPGVEMANGHVESTFDRGLTPVDGIE